MNRLKRPAFFLLTTGLLCAAGTAAYFSDFAKKDKFCCCGVCDNGDRGGFSGSYTYAYGEWSVLQKRDPDREIFSGSVKGFQADCYVRMSLSYSNDDIGRGVKLTGLDTANWVYNSQDGYYYYRKKISEGEKTAPLCTGFQIDPRRSMILTGTALKILRSMFMRKLYRQKDFQIMKVRGGIFQIRFLLRQKGGEMLEETP